jgi:hypothetical protein
MMLGKKSIILAISCLRFIYIDALFCNEIEAEALAKLFTKYPEPEAKITQSTVGIANIYDRSYCPKEDWLLHMRNADPSPSKLFVDIGFNKG